LDRKILADLAVTDETTFKSIVEQVKAALEEKTKAKSKKAA
jgi:ribosomal protein L20